MKVEESLDNRLYIYTCPKVCNGVSKTGKQWYKLNGRF